MKYKNKVSGEVIEPKTFTEKYICENNSNYEIVSNNKYKEPIEEEVVEEVIEPAEEISVEEPIEEEVITVPTSDKKKNKK